MDIRLILVVDQLDLDSFFYLLIGAIKIMASSESERRNWHVGKEVPIATIVVLLLQTAGVVWWAASINAEVKYVKESNVNAWAVQSVVDKKQDEETVRSESRIMAQLAEVNKKLDKLVDRYGQR